MTFQERPAHFKRLAWTSLAGFLFLAFSGLGTWQLFRLESKLDLIARVESRAYGSPAALPGPPFWAGMSQGLGRDEFEYTRLDLKGRFLDEHTLYSLAVTKLGSGFWVLTPMRTTEGFDVWVNRGFVANRAGQAKPKLLSGNQGGHPVSIVGLLRLSEPEGGFLRTNKPDEGRWYSRDVLAMSASRGLIHSAPYFVDAFEVRNPTLPHSRKSAQTREPEPVPGLTVLQFKNNHLVYALTWYALALMVAAATVWLRLTHKRRAAL